VTYVPHEQDEHPDHAACVPLLDAALTLVPNLSPTVYAYEVWTPLARFDHVEDVSGAIDRKLEAIRAYKSQLVEFRYDRAVEGLAAYRGALAARAEYAAVFATLR